MNDNNLKELLVLDKVRKEFRIGTFRKLRIVKAVNDISFEIKEKEVLGLVGESGSGKTTVGKIIARLYNPTSGNITLYGKNVSDKMNRKNLLQFRKEVQMIFQDPFASINPFFTIGYTLSRPFHVHKIGNKDEIQGKMEELLEKCGMKPAKEFLAKYPHEMSGGQRQRIVIARALAVNPKLIIADEPTSMLDVSIRLDIMNLILDLKEKEGLSLLYITHDLAGAHYMSDRLAIMYAGYLMEIGPAKDIINDPKHPYTQLLRKAAPKPESSIKDEKLDTGGEVPDLANMPPGCPFAPRCSHKKDKCMVEMPGYIEIAKNHKVACVLYEDNN